MDRKAMSRSLFIESLVGNIKEKYFFEKKLGSGGYGAVYLAKNKLSGRYLIINSKLAPFIFIHDYLPNNFTRFRRESCNQGHAKV